MIIENIQTILNDNKIYPKKEYGQNFIISEKPITHIIEISNITKEDYIIEIGPGLGSLTEMLVNKAKKVICYEIDYNMVRILKETFKDKDNIKIIQGDFLRQDIEKDIYEFFGENIEVKLVANIPYYITTPILQKVLKNKKIISHTVMVQKEFGDKLIKKEGKDINPFTLSYDYYMDIVDIEKVSKGNFYPIPKIDSVIIFSKRKEKLIPVINEKSFLRFLKHSFSQKRKTFINNISVSYKISKIEIENIIKKLGKEKNIRSQDITLLEFIAIYNKMEEMYEIKSIC